jgi:hypothetical protein
LEGLFNIYWTTPTENLLKELLQTWEVIKEGIMQIFIDQISIHKQLGISSKKVVNVVNALIKKVEVTLKRLAGSNAFVENE